MTIKRIDERVTAVTFSRGELASFGVTAEHFTPRDPDGQRLLGFLWGALEKLCGLRRDGNVTFLECRPYIHGGCRFCVGFSELAGVRTFCFACADDLLDALNALRRGGIPTDTFSIDRADSRYSLTLPPDAQSSRRTLALLSEYSLDDSP